MPSICSQQPPSTSTWNGTIGTADRASEAMRGLPSVCQAPDGMKQNCSAPVRRMLRSTSDRASFSPGFAIKFFGDPAKDGSPCEA